MNLLEIFFKFQNYILLKFGLGEVIFIRKHNINAKNNSTFIKDITNRDFIKDATINGC